MQYKVHSYLDPFSTDKDTRLIHLNDSYPSVETAALLSRYSRTTHSLEDLIEGEFKDKDRAPTFISKLLNEYGDESIAEMSSQTFGIEGISILAASKLTDQRIGVSFIEKSTRYVPFTEFYIPSELYEIGLVDEYKELCVLSQYTFKKIFDELCLSFEEKYPISSCRFTDTLYTDLKTDEDRKLAQKSYDRAIKDKAYDIAGYSWLAGLKTNIGMNANSRALKYMVENTASSPLSELNILSTNIQKMLSPSPFLNRLKITQLNPFDIYSKTEPSITSVYKANIIDMLKPRDDLGDELNSDKAKRNDDIIKNLISEMGMASTRHNKIKYRRSAANSLSIETQSFGPRATVSTIDDEKNIIDTLCSTILYENNENLLDYDIRNSNNIDDSLRIEPVDTRKVKEGILHEIINEDITITDILEEEKKNNFVNRITENEITFDDLIEYFYYTKTENDRNVCQDGDSEMLFFNKDQEFLLKKYMGDRKSRRDKLGRAFEFVHYSFELSSSFRIMREFKRHRTLSAIYPKVLTARNSYDSFIFPIEIIRHKDLFDVYKNLIDKSFNLYQKIVAKSGYVTAQYVLPLSVRCNYLAKINIRELDYLLSLRTTAQAHEEFRKLAQEMYFAIKLMHPNIVKLFKFVDFGRYDLGRLSAETKREIKLSESMI
jgi:thymidylate synthase ThyX